MKKNSCTPINPKKYSCYGLKKKSYKEFDDEKKSLRLENSPPPLPITFVMVRPLLFHFSGHNNDLLVLKQWKGALNRIMPSLLGLLENNDQGLGALASHAGVFKGARFSSLHRYYSI